MRLRDERYERLCAERLRTEYRDRTVDLLDRPDPRYASASDSIHLSCPAATDIFQHCVLFAMLCTEPPYESMRTLFCKRTTTECVDDHAVPVLRRSRDASKRAGHAVASRLRPAACRMINSDRYRTAMSDLSEFLEVNPL